MLRGWIGPQLTVLTVDCMTPLHTTGLPQLFQRVKEYQIVPNVGI